MKSKNEVLIIKDNDILDTINDYKSIECIKDFFDEYFDFDYDDYEDDDRDYASISKAFLKRDLGQLKAGQELENMKVSYDWIYTTFEVNGLGYSFKPNIKILSATFEMNIF